MANKIFTTFTTKDKLEETLDKIKSNYTILYDKIFKNKRKERAKMYEQYRSAQLHKGLYNREHFTIT